ncbi:DUF3558 domain-containing protein [Rhodococcus sp. Q]|uniref:DUF3558 domain-containing protein n=1 Tax=Rhodococcus sp. Q TaxID=2502252 RepID=UPI0010F6EDA1|nr:DUF3558 domain-containing protein [Rhodococcus sp. Q]
MRTTIGVMLCAAALVSGCGTVSGQAEPENPTASDPAFDPCEDIPDEVIVELGMDPATEGRDILGVHQPGWNICGWNDDSVAMTAYSARLPLSDVRLNTDYQDFQDIALDGQPALMFHSVEPISVRCYVATGSHDGLLMVAFSVRNADDGDPCVRARDGASEFRRYAGN